MDFLMGRVFVSPIGQRIQKATRSSLESEDWSLNMEICDIINETDDGPKDAVKALKRRIVGNKNFREVMLALTVLETCVKNCGNRFHVHVCTKEFVEGVLVRSILPKNNPPMVLQDRLLSLIQAWADAFRNKPALSGVVRVYDDLKRRGLEFPMTDLDALSPIQTPSRSAPEDDSSPAAPSTRAEQTNGVPVPISAEQKEKLRAELDLVKGNLNAMTNLLNQFKPGDTLPPSDAGLLRQLYTVCKTMQLRVADLIPSLCEEDLIGELLVINDDLHKAFTRYERFQQQSDGQGTAPPADSAQELEDLLSFDTVVTANQTSAEPVNQTESNPTAELIKTSGEEDEFDMFAQTRGSSLAEQRKSVRYEDPSAVEGLAGALDSRLLVTSEMDSAQSSVLDDIEKWFSAETYDEDDEDDGATSEEFNKFLAARAKAVENLPSAPSEQKESAQDQLLDF